MKELKAKFNANETEDGITIGYLGNDTRASNKLLVTTNKLDESYS